MWEPSKKLRVSFTGVSTVNMDYKATIVILGQSLFYKKAANAGKLIFNFLPRIFNYVDYSLLGC